MHTIQPNCTKNEGQLRDKPFDLVLQLRAKWQQPAATRASDVGLHQSFLSDRRTMTKQGVRS
ncbi:MAG: hypothetical protein ED554_12460 [Synechococcus sp. YX04-3]|nr:MAG: hypothetical protein ED554_12460 [Synechococcus sp. YX04-3]